MARQFHEKSVHGLMTQSVKEIRRNAPKCPTLMSRRGGVIRFDFVPGEGSYGDDFRRWLGMPLGEFREMDSESLQMVYRIFPDWNFRIRCEDGDEHGWVDCAAYAEMKAASCAMRAMARAGFDSGPLPDVGDNVFKCADEWGYAEHKGAIVFIITEKDSPCEKVLGEVYVVVSGGTQEEDEILAKSTAPIINDFFDEDPHAEILPASRHLS